MRPAPLIAAWTFSLLTLPMLSQAAPLAPPVEEIRKHLRAGDIDAAVDASDSAVEQRDDDATAWLWAGRAYGRQAMEANMLMKAKWAGRTREAYETAVELDPSLIDARFDLMQYYLVAPGIVGGGRDKAEAQAASIGQLSPAMGKVAQGSLAQADKDLATAEQRYREAMALDPASSRPALALSGLLQAAERWDELHAHWQARRQANPEDATAVYQLGRWSALTGRELEAGLAHLDAFIAAGRVPDELSLPAAQWRRGQILEKLGRMNEAAAALEIAVSDPGVANQAEADLERVRAARG